MEMEESFKVNLRSNLLGKIVVGQNFNLGRHSQQLETEVLGGLLIRVLSVGWSAPTPPPAVFISMKSAPMYIF